MDVSIGDAACCKYEHLVAFLSLSCVCFLPIHSGPLIHLNSAVRALVFLARKIQPFLSLVDREVEFCVLTI